MNNDLPDLYSIRIDVQEIIKVLTDMEQNMVQLLFMV